MLMVKLTSRYIAFIRSLSKKRDHTVSWMKFGRADCKDAETILKAVGELDSDTHLEQGLTEQPHKLAFWIPSEKRAEV